MDRQSLTEEITRQVLARLTETGARLPAETIAIIGSALPLPQRIFEDVAAAFGEEVAYYTFDAALHYPGASVTPVTDRSIQTLTEEAAACQTLVILCPSAAMLADLAGTCAEPLSRFLLRGLLWGKAVEVWLDYAPHILGKSPLFEPLLKAISALESAGAAVTSFAWAERLGKRSLPTLVTEKDVLDASRAGETELVCAEGAVLTPLARDRIAELNMRITTQEL